MPKLVYDFPEGNKDLKDLLGGKGANLAEMTNLGLPVPPGFIITTEACRYYLEHGSIPEGLDDEIAAHLDLLVDVLGHLEFHDVAKRVRNDVFVVFVVIAFLRDFPESAREIGRNGRFLGDDK